MSGGHLLEFRATVVSFSLCGDNNEKKMIKFGKTKLHLLVFTIRPYAFVSFSPNKYIARRSQWNRYYTFCEKFSLPALPVTAHTVCRFLVFVGDELSYTSLNNYVSALNSLGKFYDGTFDLRKDYGVVLLLRGFKRVKGDITSPKDPLTPSDLKLIFREVNLLNPLHLTVWLIVLLAFRTLLRKSHFLSTSTDDQEHLLHTKDITFEDWGCKVNITSSKTIQFGQRSFNIPVSFAQEPLCAVSLLKTYLEKFPKRDSDWLFTMPNSSNTKPFSYKLALDLLKSWAVSAKIDKDIGFHSLRRGAASFMHSLKIELVSIQKAGDWRSLCVLDYLTVDFEQKRKIESLVSSSL